MKNIEKLPSEFSGDNTTWLLILDDKINELIDWQNEMVELIKWSEVHMKPFTVEANDASLKPTTTIKIPKEFAEPTYQSYVSDFESEGMTPEDAKKLAKRLTDEPHTSDTSFREAVDKLLVFAVSHSAKQGNDEEQQITVTSGLKCLELYNLQNPNGSLQRMCQGLLTSKTAWYSSRCVLTWKPKVTKSKRLLFQLSPSMHRTAGIGSGLLPTPNTLDGIKPKQLDRIVAHNQKARPGRSYLSMNLRELMAYGHRKLDGTGGVETGRMLQPSFVEWMMGYPIGWTELKPSETPSSRK